MNAYDFEAVVHDGLVYCTACLPVAVDVEAAEVSPIFASEQWDAPATCERCNREHGYMTIVGG